MGKKHNISSIAGKSDPSLAINRYVVVASRESAVHRRLQSLGCTEVVSSCTIIFSGL
jgi:hypothetical protein